MYSKNGALWLCGLFCSLLIMSFLLLGRGSASPSSQEVNEARKEKTNRAPMEKASVPIDLNWQVTSSKRISSRRAPRDVPDANGYEGIGQINVKVPSESLRSFAFDGGAANLNLQITTQGGVSIVSQQRLLSSNTLNSVAETPKKDKLPFTISEGQRGVIIAEANVASPNGKTIFGKKAYLYLIATKRKLYAGTSSFIELDIQKLKDDLSAGLINKQQYESEIRKLVSGGAVETNTPPR